MYNDFPPFAHQLIKIKIPNRRGGDVTNIKGGQGQVNSRWFASMQLGIETFYNNNIWCQFLSFIYHVHCFSFTCLLVSQALHSVLPPLPLYLYLIISLLGLFICVYILILKGFLFYFIFHKTSAIRRESYWIKKKVTPSYTRKMES